jgi:ATP-dependent DNA helicase DinG
MSAGRGEPEPELSAPSTADGPSEGVTAAEAVLERLCRALGGRGEVREGQRLMVAEVATALAEGGSVAIQAGTGVGKSFGYLAPIGATRGRRRGPAVVVTSTIGLQEQLARSDLPALAGVLDEPLTWAVVKGMSNYACLAKALGTATANRGTSRSARGLGSLFGGRGEEPSTGGASSPETGAPELGLPEALDEWLAKTADGDVEGAPVGRESKEWASLAADADDCPGQVRCPFGGGCFVFAARRRAAGADVVVTNASLYGMHLRSRGKLLPPHEVLVVDEAHAAPELWSKALAAEVSGRSVLEVARLFGRVLGGQREALTDDEDRLRSAVVEAGSRLDLALDEVAREANGPWTTLLVAGGLDHPVGTASPTGEAAPSLRSVLADLTVPLAAMASLVRSQVGEVQRADAASRLDVGSPGSPAGPALRRIAELERLGRRVQAQRDRLLQMLDADPGQWATVLVRLADDRLLLRVEPIDVGLVLAGGLWAQVGGLGRAEAAAGPDAEGEVDGDDPDDDPGEDDDAVRLRSVVLTSATLPAGVLARLGALWIPRRVVPSPYDYRRQMALYVPARFPDPKAGADWQAAVDEELAALIDAAGGRTLALFTSRQALERAAASLERSLGRRYPVLVQGRGGSVSTLLRRFAEEEAACLLGTRTFFQGIDVPGRSLSLVVLDRVPFPSPGDAMVKARLDAAGPAAFRSVLLPEATVLLEQAMGRLVRARGDAGVVAVLDTRLVRSPWAGQVRAELQVAFPGHAVLTGRAQAVAVLERLAGSVGAAPSVAGGC